MKTRQELMDGFTDRMIAAATSIDTEKKTSRTARVTGRYWPTDASANTPVGVVGRCRRWTYYDQAGIAKPPEDIQTYGRFHVGYKVEEWVRELARKAGIYQGNSVKIVYPIPGQEQVVIAGEVDLMYKIDDETVGGEIKSSYGYKFANRVFHKVTVPGMPLVSHVLQVLLYLYYFRVVDTSVGISRFIMTYVDRGSMEWIQHVVELSDKLEPIINGIRCTGLGDYTNPIYKVPKLNQQKVHAKLGAYEFNLLDVFQRYMDIYAHHESGLLIARDYNPLLSEEEIETQHNAGEISNNQYKEYKDGKQAFICDDDCTYCPFRLQCLRDEGMIG